LIVCDSCDGIRLASLSLSRRWAEARHAWIFLQGGPIMLPELEVLENFIGCKSLPIVFRWRLSKANANI